MSKALAYVLFALGLAYACLWWSYEQFYGHFRVSPQDVGLSQGGSFVDLSGAALQLGIWLVLLIVLLALVPTAAAAAFAAARTCRERRHKLWSLVAGAILFGFSIFLYAFFVEDWPGPILVLSAWAIVGAAAKAMSLAGFGRPSSVSAGRSTGIRRIEEFVGASLRPTLGIFLATAVIGIALIDLPSDADEAGRCAAGGQQSVTSLNMPIPGLHLQILNVHAQPARLTWLTNARQNISPSVVYLGQGSGYALVYDAVTKGTSRIPAGDVIVTIDSGVKSCSGVH